MKRFLLAGLCTVVLTGPSFAVAQSLPDVDLRSSLGPNLNQGDTGWCFAFAASDLLTSALKRRVSPVDVALNYFSGMKSLEKGARDLGDWISGRHAAAMQIRYNGGFIAPASQTMQGIGICEVSQESPEIQDFYSVSDLYALLQSPNFNAETTCQHRSGAFKIELAEYGPGSGPSRGSIEDDQGDKLPLAMVPAINDSLSAGYIAGIEYDDRMVKNKDAGREFFYFQNTNHASSVVARKTVKGVTFYLVRNSWGSSCDFSRSDRECEDGNTWVTSQDIARMVSAVVVIKSVQLPSKF